MTAEEHKLMVSMFATHLKLHVDLLNVLMDRGILTRSAAAALQQAGHDAKEAPDIVSLVRTQYVAHAKILGLDIDLPEPNS